MMADSLHMHNVKWLHYTKNMLDTQRSLHLSQSMYDVIVVAGERRFKAHKLILSTSSQFFVDIFETSPKNRTETIIIPDINPLLVELLLTFIYTGEVYVPPSSLPTFLDLGFFLQVKGFISRECYINGVRLEQKTKHTIVKDPKIVTVASGSPIEAHNDNHSLRQSSSPMNIIEYRSPSAYSESGSYVVLSEIIEDDTGKAYDESQIIDEISIDDEVAEVSESDILIEENIDEKYKTIEHTLVYEADDATNDVELIEVKQQPGGDDENAYDGVEDKSTLSDNDEALMSAIEALQRGKSVNQVADEFNLPKLAIYRKLRHNPKYRNYYRTVRHAVINDAVKAVTIDGLSLQQASTQYAVSKTVLWRNLKKTTLYRPEEKVHAFRSDAIAALERGESLSYISKKYNIPLSTLHRDKVRLYDQGKLPKHCTVRKREGGPDFQNRLKAALNCCERGLSQKVASEMHNIPKTTIWRYLRYSRGNSGERLRHPKIELVAQPDDKDAEMQDVVIVTGEENDPEDILG